MDLRVKRTQKNIREAFISLAEKKKVERMTIKELAETAMINKATFYLHYRDLEDFVSQLENEVIDDILSEIGQVDSFFRRVDEFFERFTVALIRNQKLMVILYDNDWTNSFQNKLVISLREKILAENNHLEFTPEMNIILTFMLRGVMDISLYEEFEDPDEVFRALSNTIRVVTDHYRAQVHARRREKARQQSGTGRADQ